MALHVASLLGTDGTDASKVFFEDGVFSIEGRGDVEPSTVTDLHLSGQLEWVSPEVRSWYVGTYAATLKPAAESWSVSGLPQGHSLAHCLACGAAATVPSDWQQWRCQACSTDTHISRCASCGLVKRTPRVGSRTKSRCPRCGHFAVGGLATVADWEREVVSLGEERLTFADDFARREVRVVVGGAIGYDIAPQEEAVLYATSQGLAIRAPRVQAVHPLGEVIAFEIGGPGKKKHNLGLIGGGFGLEGAAKGIFAATVINSLTTFTTITTFLLLKTTCGEVAMVNDTIPPEWMKRVFSDTLVSISRQSAAPQVVVQQPTVTSVASVAEEIERLAALHASGHLTDEEFQAAKRRLLGL